MTQGNFPPNPYEGPQAGGAQQAAPQYGAPYGGAPMGPSGGMPGGQPPASGMAVAALILGIIGIMGGMVGAFLGFVGCCADIPAIIAIILGFVARNQIKQSNGRQGGLGMATTGAVLGIVAIAVQLLGFVIIMIIAVSMQAHP